MNVLHISESAGIGGDETNLINLLSHLDRWEFNVHVVVFAEGELTQKLKELKIPYTMLSSVGLFAHQIWRELRQIMEEHQIELIHTHGSKAAFHALICSRKLNIPVVRTIHRWPFYYQKNFFKKKFYRLLEKQITSRTTHNIAVSECVANSGLQYLGLDNFQVIPNGVDTSLFHPGQPGKISKTSLGIPASRTVVGFMSRLSPQKDPLTLIRAFAMAQARDRNLHLLLVGKGKLKQQCMKEVHSLGIREFVTHLDYHPHPNEILKLMDIFCLPSLFESLPLALLEAMSMKRAVITTPVNGITEIVADNVDGLLAPVGDVEKWSESILNLHHNPGLRRELGQRARLVVDYHHNVKLGANETANIYRKLHLNHAVDQEKINYSALRRA